MDEVRDYESEFEIGLNVVDAFRWSIYIFYQIQSDSATEEYIKYILHLKNF